MADRWNINFIRGKTYQQTITVAGIADIATATAWHIDCAMPNETPFLQASTANGYLIAGATSAQKILVVPASATANYAAGNGRFTFWIEWAGGVKRPYYTGLLTVNPDVGEVQS